MADQSILEIALDYIERGWNPVPIPFREKGPTGNGWQARVITADTAPQFFNGGPQNIGVILGPTSRGLTDIDLDCPEAIALAPYILPATDAVFGRQSKPASHFLYATELAGVVNKAAQRFKDPTPNAMMVELRIGGAKGAQTVFPGSIHESGEAIIWVTNGEPATVDSEELQHRVRELAAYCLIVRHWPAPGSGGGHDAGLIFGGFLARLGRSADEIERITEMIAAVTGDPKAANRVQAAVDAAQAHVDGKNAYGLPALCETFGEREGKKIAKWLGYQDTPQPQIDERRAGLPQLHIDAADLTATAKQLAEMVAARDDFLFNGNWPIRIITETGDVPRAIEVTKEALRVEAHEICNPVVVTKRGSRPVSLGNDVAVLYLNGLAGRWGLKPFRGITTTPILGDDGSIRSASGYDSATGLWCHNIPTLSMPDAPNEQEVRVALARIRHTFRTFPFADGERVADLALEVEVIDPSKPAGLDESSFAVALLTAACRPCLELAPGFLCEAPSFSGAGTGKGMLVKAICIIASGASPSAFTSGHDADEFDKRLTAALVQARPAIFLDNFNGKELKSDILDSALTENPAEVRIMGQTKMVPLHVRTFIGITGNGVQPAQDMARRLIVTRLDAKMENPEERKFAPGFLNGIAAARANLLTDALTIWRWGRQNKDMIPCGRPLGSYEVWCEWVRDPLLALGMRDPVERVGEIKAEDPKRQAICDVFDAWWAIHRGESVKASDLAREVTERIPDAHGFDGSVNRQRVAGWLRQHASTRVGGYGINQIPGSSHGEPVKLYQLTKITE
jgi:Bifunctional DNA primase/polymerase, N-terminal